jgi:hypothetical protein
MQLMERPAIDAPISDRQDLPNDLQNCNTLFELELEFPKNYFSSFGRAPNFSPKFATLSKFGEIRGSIAQNFEWIIK